MDKDTRAWARDVERYLGLTVRTTAKGHVQVVGPDGAVLVTTSVGPADRRSLDNATAQLRRAGFDLKAAKRTGKRARRQT